MEIREYLSILKRRKWIIVTTSIIMLAAVYAVAQIIPQNYTATARLRLKTPVGGSSSYVDFNIWYADRLMNTYADLAKSSSVLEELNSRLNLKENPSIVVSVVPSSELIKISAKATDPILSANIANALAEIIVDITSKSSDDDELTSNYFLRERELEVENQLNEARNSYELLINPLATDKARAEFLRNTIYENREVYINLKDRYDEYILREDIEFQQRLSLTNQMAEIQKKIEQDEEELNSLNISISENSENIEIIKAEIALRVEELSSIKSQLDQARISELIQENTFVVPIIDPAIAPNKSNLNRLLIFVIGAILSLMIALGVGFIVDHLDPRLYIPEEISSLLNIPLIGTIPSNRRNIQRISTGTTNDYSEAIRRLRINIIRIAKAKELKTFVICKAGPPETKSTIVANLSEDLARSGKNIIAVDADLHMPKLHEHFELPNARGLSNYLGGKAEAESFIQNTEFPNLKVMTGGPISQKPAELISSPRMKKLISNISDGYDFVLIDASDILLFSDVDELSTYVDGTILIVDISNAKWPKVQAAANQIRVLESEVVGVIINITDSSIYSRLYKKITLARDSKVFLEQPKRTI